MTPRIQKAIDIFLDAINEGTLMKGSCAACAVGNLIMDALDRRYTQKQLLSNNILHSRIATLSGNIWNPYIPKEERTPHLNKTSFTIAELREIECEFESHTTIHWFNYRHHTRESIRADQIRGLEAVVKVMLEFDNQQDDVNEVFTKRAEQIPV